MAGEIDLALLIHVPNVVAVRAEVGLPGHRNVVERGRLHCTELLDLGREQGVVA